MASRMERYSKNDLVTNGRSSKNESLYKQIENLDNYTNIEGVATIEKTNEVDISKIKEMLKNRENYKKRRKLKNILIEEKENLQEEVEEVREPKNYDINDVLSRVKQNTPIEGRKERSLSEEQYEFLKSLKTQDKQFDIQKEEMELKALINTISNNEELNELSEIEDVGLLDDLKSDTMVGNASAIRNIIDKEKDTPVEQTMEMDKSFYTSSFGFTSSDFEELKQINHKIKKSNKLIIVLLSIVILLIIVGCIYFIIK